MDYTRFFGKRVARRKENLIRKFTEMRSLYPNAISLAGGMPNPHCFPIKAISVTYNDGICKNLTGADLNAALQYGPSQGHLPLVKKYRDFQQKWHSPVRNDWDVAFTAGSQDGFCKILELILDEGEPIMVQAPAYTATIGAIRPLDSEFIGIQQDADGIIPEELEKICEQRIRKKKSIPKVLYVNPIAANPTASMLTMDRTKKVYELAQKYDFLIIEDDPYYFLHFLDEQPKSFLSIDTDGRVIRLDSFSKIISAGLRLGVVTANKEIIAKLVTHIENSILHSSALSQTLIYQLFETWSPERFEQHFKETQRFYKEKRDVMLNAIEKHLTGLAEWSVPQGGMFVWIKIPGVADTLHLTLNKLVPNGVFVVPGNAFDFDENIPNQHLRLCYSFATTDEVEKALSLIAKAIRGEVAKTKNIPSE